MNIKQKAVVFSIAIFLLIVIAGALITRSIIDLNRQSEAIQHIWKPVSDLSYEMQIDVVQVQQWLTDISATRGLDGLNDGFDEAEIAAKGFEKTLNLIESLVPEEREHIKKLRAVFKNYYALGREMAQAYVDGGPALGNLTMASFDSGAEDLHTVLGELLANTASKIDAAYARQSASLQQAKGLVGATFLLILALLSIAIIQGRKIIVNPLERIKLFIENAEQQGDLSQRFVHDSCDEIGAMATSLNGLFTSVNRLVGEANGVLAKVEQGEFERNQIVATFNGDLERLKHGINKAINDMARYAQEQRSSQESMQAQQRALEQQQQEMLAVASVQQESNRVLESQKETMLAQQVKMEKAAQEMQAQHLIASQHNAALNAASANITLLDNRDNIIFYNTSVNKLFAKAQPILQQRAPQFNVKQLLNFNPSVFFEFKDGKKAFGELSEACEANLNISELHINIIAVPVFDENNVRIGTVLEWSDNSEQVHALQEIANAVDSASEGDLTHRVKLTTDSVFMNQLANNINALMDSVSHAMAIFSKTFLSMEQGDLGASIEETLSGDYDAIKKSTNHMLDVWRNVLVSVQDLSANVRSGAQGIASSASQLASRAEQQASSLEETASSMEDMTSMIAQYSKIYEQGSIISSELEQKTQTGNQVVLETVAAIDDIHRASKEISGITNVIDEIAFQTNLLALNAAVEAARAGESGRGFAVVAAEVRNLAQRSSSAAKEISALITDTVTKAESGAVLADKSRECFVDIQRSVSSVGEMMSKIRASAEEQNNSVLEIQKAVQMLDQMTQANTSDVDSLSTDCGDLHQRADSLQGSLMFFRNFR